MKSLLTPPPSIPTLCGFNLIHRHSAKDGKGIEMTRNVTSRKSAHRVANSLRLENLESRRLLAVAALQSELLQDNNGSPGALIADNTIAAGDTFFLRITAQEFNPMRFGLGSVGVDVVWDANLLDVIEEDFKLESVITPHLPILQEGTLDQQLGTIQGLAGTALGSLGAGRRIGNAIPETFALIRMRAGSEPGVATLHLEKGLTKTVIAPATLLDARHMRFDSETITIVAAESEPDPVQEPANEPALMESLEAIEETIAVAPSTEVEAMPVSAVTTPPVMTQETATETIPDTIAQALAVALEVAPPPVAVPTPSAAPTIAAAVDKVLSFDFNGDGVFDFADFGPINVRAAVASPPQDAAGTAVTSAPEQAVKPAVVTLNSLHTCMAIPAMENVEATEAWLDAFAVAWLADSDSRARRRDEAKLF